MASADTLGDAATPSGKWSNTENFPVGSHLIAAKHRPHVMAFYAFARTIDDVADSPDLKPDEKIERLHGFEAAVTGQSTHDQAYAAGHRCRIMLERTGVTPKHCQDLIDAFRQDSVKGRYADWDELIDYCLRSAAPVGRFLLDLHGEDVSLYPASDALCNALQIINHLQDLKEDLLEIDRVYVPEPMLEEAGLKVEDLAGEAMPPALRQIVDQLLDGVDELLTTSSSLAGAMADRRLAMETAAIQALAERLSGELRRRDPLAERVKLDKIQMLTTALKGAFFGRRRAA
ncbi:MAG: squalene synthase HpnC [Alphaproteobacteria bacterium]|nr:squalene synthase HpnC [Alphaproteobacteria bacterium SS10]